MFKGINHLHVKGLQKLMFLRRQENTVRSEVSVEIGHISIFNLTNIVVIKMPSQNTNRWYLEATEFN